MHRICWLVMNCKGQKYWILKGWRQWQLKHYIQLQFIWTKRNEKHICCPRWSINLNNTKGKDKCRKIGTYQVLSEYSTEMKMLINLSAKSGSICSAAHSLPCRYWVNVCVNIYKINRQSLKKKAALHRIGLQ